MNFWKKPAVRHAILIGSLCSTSYLGVYFARNILSALTPQIIETTSVTTESIGTISGAYFMLYAIGQLINGMIGDKIKARYMISFGLILAGAANALFPLFIESETVMLITYGLTGFFLSMIYAPMTKVVAENTEPIYATRCSLGYTVASFLGTPLAGFAAALMTWQAVFFASSGILIAMGICCFILFLCLEKKGIVQYGRFQREKKKGGGIGVLIKHRILRFTVISITTGVVRTSVVFWMPTYLAQHLGFSNQSAAAIFTVTTFLLSATAFIAVFIYERLGRKLDLTIFLSFAASSAFFVLVYLIPHPVWNTVFLGLAILFSCCAASMLWSRYCPSLYETGMVSSATGFLDFVSYMSAAISSKLFADAVSAIGWGKLILIWLALMLIGMIVFLPVRAKNRAQIGS